MKNSRRSSRRRKIAKVNKRHKKWQNYAKWHRRAKKCSKEQENLKVNTKTSKSTHPPEINSP
jgi:hypothetical protein